ncbi:hypothetical protein Tco_0008966 [Tanacetum coccineum]
MLDKDLYDYWKSRMELYMQNREHERMILESVEHGPLIWPMIEENRVTRTKKYDELYPIEKIQADCDMKEISVNCRDAFDKFLTNIRGITSLHAARDKVLLVEAQGNGKDLIGRIGSLGDEPCVAEDLFMANLSSYGSDVLSEVPISDNTNNDMLNQSVQEMSYSEPSNFVEHPENEIYSDSNIIPYSEYSCSGYKFFYTTRCLDIICV